MNEKIYNFDYRYDVPDDIIDSKISSIDIKKSNKEINSASIQIDPTIINKPESTYASLRLSNFIKDGVVIDLNGLNKFLSVCLYREDLTEVINNFDMFGSETKIIALSNPLCYYELIKEVAYNEMNNFDTLVSMIANNILKNRESKYRNY